MATSLLNATVLQTVTLDTAAYTASLTVNRYGSVLPAEPERIAVFGDTGTASLRNNGTVAGGGRYRYGIGVDLTAGGTVINQIAGAISGGSARYAARIGAAIAVSGGAGTVRNSGYVGGYCTGITFAAGGVVNNRMHGTIAGGSGGVNGPPSLGGVVIAGGFGEVRNGGSIGSGNVGVSLASGVLLNRSHASIFGGYGGVGVDASGAVVTNEGRIDSFELGLRLAGGGTVLNSGSITVEARGAYGYYGSGNGIQADRVALVTNTGTIQGGGLYLSGTSGGIGVLLAGGGMLTNSGRISGGAGTYQSQYRGGMGVSLTVGGTLINDGTIAGGAGTHDGTQGDAVLFGAGGPGLLVVRPGAVFQGQVVGNGVSDTLELSSFSPLHTFTFAGLNTQFVGFTNVEVDFNTRWAFVGATTIVSGQTLGVEGQISGGSTLVNDGLINGGGFAQVYKALINEGNVVAVGGSLGFESGVRNDGTITVLSGSLRLAGGAVTGSGQLDIAGTGATLTVLRGGAASQVVDFQTNAGTLAVGAPLQFRSEIEGFAKGDAVHLLAGQATSLEVAGGRVDVMNGKHLIASLDFAGTISAADFTLKGDGHGGTWMTHV